jgi:hypothetical protein
MNPNSRSVSRRLLSFAHPASVEAFHVVNDGVMGGISTSRVSHAGGLLRFEGLLSLENGGGFASFRGPVVIPCGATELWVYLRGDQRRYKFLLKTGDAAARWQYQAPFSTSGDWQRLRFEAGNFSARFRGKPVDAPALNLEHADTFGILLADSQAGSFRLEISEILAG